MGCGGSAPAMGSEAGAPSPGGMGVLPWWVFVLPGGGWRAWGWPR